MTRDSRAALRFGWGRQIKKLAAEGDLTALDDLVDFAEGHLEQIGVFDRMWVGILNGATQRGLAVEITREYALHLLQSQGFRCAISGLPIGFRGDGLQPVGRKVSGTASLDRIDSGRPYTPGNVWWVHRDINRMKWNLPLSRFVELCELVSRNAEALMSEAAPQPLQSAAATLAPSHDGPASGRATVRTFLDQCVTADAAGEESAERLWRALRGWCADMGAAEASQTLLGRGLAALGYQRITGRSVRWCGLRLTERGLDCLERCLGLSDPVEAWWIARLRVGGLGDPPRWPSVIGCDALLRDCLTHMQAEGRSTGSVAISFGIRLRKLAPRATRIRAVPPEGRARVWCYRLPPLPECRARFDLQPAPEVPCEGFEGCEGTRERS